VRINLRVSLEVNTNSRDRVKKSRHECLRTPT